MIGYPCFIAEQDIEMLPGAAPFNDEWLTAAGAAASNAVTGLRWAGAAHWRFRPITTSRTLAAGKGKANDR